MYNLYSYNAIITIIYIRNKIYHLKIEYKLNIAYNYQAKLHIRSIRTKIAYLSI